MKNWSLSYKLYFVISVLIFSNILTIGIGLNKLSNLNSSMDNINNSIYKRIEVLNKINASQLFLSIKIRDIMLSTNLDEQKKMDSEMVEKKQFIDTKLDDFLAIASPAGKIEGLKYKELLSSWYNDSKEVFKLSQELKNKEAFVISKSKLSPLRKAMEVTLGGIITLNETRMNDASLKAAEDYSSAKNQIFLISAISIIFSIFLAVFIIKNLGISINNIIINLNRNTDQLASASAEIASSSEQLSHANTETAASLQETSSSIEEISSMINANTENAKKSSNESIQSLNNAEKGKQVVGHMINAIGDIENSNTQIANQMDETNKELESIVRIINEIGTKTKVINDIVFQTKLLSFNASVEAARAGEQGKGFTVVAEEVGNLASMSGAAALEITNMLDGSIKKVEEIVKSSKGKIGKLISDGKVNIDAGTRIASECSDVLNDIVYSVGSVSKMVTEISSASQEQAQGVQEITKAIAQLDQVTQENTANSAESANASSALSNQAEELNILVQELVVTIQGSNGARVERKNVSPTKPTSTTKKTSKGHTPANNDHRFKDIA